MPRKRPEAKRLHPKSPLKKSSTDLPSDVEENDAEEENIPDPVPMEMESNNQSDAEPLESPSHSQDRVTGSDYADIEVEIPAAPEPVMNFDGTGPRLIITHIVNDNFKSYFGKHILGPFHKSFTSIVGPNGSGKSNVIDSMLFVFGYRGQKIRTKKISSLIHHSEKHQTCKFCSVEVHFQKIIDQDGDSYEVVPNSSFSVSRTANADNSSSYKIDDRRVQFKEVATLLRKNGIDIDHNRFLILQGEVEQIAMMKPKGQNEGDEGMLEYLEDIVGSSRFKEPIEQLAKKVEELNELRQEKLNRVKVVEKEKEQLEGAKDEAVEYLEMENAIIRDKNALYQSYLFECSSTVQKVDKENVELRESFDKINTRMAEIKSLLADKKTLSKETHKKFDAANAMVEERKVLFDKMQMEDVKVQEDLKYSRNKAKKLQKQLDVETAKLEELKSLPVKSQKEIEELNDRIETAERKKSELETKIQSGLARLRDETQAVQVLKEQKEIQLLAGQKVVTDAKQKMDIAQSELDLCRSNQLSEERKLSDMERSLENCVSNIGDRQKQLAAIEENYPKKEEDLRRATQELVQVTAEETKISSVVRADRLKAEEARSSMNNNRTRSRVLDALFEQKRTGSLPGIHGRLGDLAAIDEKYDVAISTACGSLDNVVVNSIDVAQSCVEFLKRNNVGQATFIGLDKMERFRHQMDQRMDTPEGVPRLFDLIRDCSDAVRPAFYYALRDTLVAKDLDQATRIALQGRTRHRVVTLAGEVIDQSGTMSGGGNRPSRGRMGRNVAQKEEFSAEKVGQMEEKLATDGAKLEGLRRKRLELEIAIDALKKDLNELRPLRERCQIDLKAFGDQQRNLAVQIKRQRKVVEESTADPEKIREFQVVVDRHKKEYEKVSKVSDALDAEVVGLSEQIKTVSDKLVGSFEKKLKELQKQMDEWQKGVTKCSVAIKTNDRNVQKVANKLSELQEELQSNEKDIERLQLKLTEIEEKATAIVTANMNSKSDCDLITAELESVKKEIRKIEAEEQELSGAFIEEKAKLENAEKVLADLTKKKTYWQKELNKLSLHVIDESIAPKPAAAKDDEESDEGEQQSQPRGNEPLKRFTEEELDEMDIEGLKYQMTVEEAKLGKMKPNMTAIAEYKKKAAQYLERVEQLDAVSKSRERHRHVHDQLRKQRLEEFLGGFTVISQKLKEMYQMITLGGDAELELVDSMDPFAEGIVFSVRPPKKSWKQISNLSGGEKTLSSLALVFALHHYRPTPLYVMDEIDAALDFKNVSIVANYIKDRTKNAQFIIISLRNNMFELANRLVGIYKTYHCTKSVVIDPDLIGIDRNTVAA